MESYKYKIPKYHLDILIKIYYPLLFFLGSYMFDEGGSHNGLKLRGEAQAELRFSDSWTLAQN